MLKTDLHIHTREDPEDKWINYSAKNIIDKASELKYDVLSITEHNKLYCPKDLIIYAKSKGILLIPGIELEIEKKHILLYNFKESEIKNIKKISDIKRYKNETNLVIASHPFFKTRSCIGNLIYKYNDIFDGVEFSFFYNNLINLNKKALKYAKENNKVVIANSDLHNLNYFGRIFTKIESNRNIDDIIIAIKNKETIINTKPFSMLSFIWIIIKMTLYDFYRMIKK